MGPAFRVFDPTPCAFPAPRVPLLPTLAAAAPAGDSEHGFRRIGAGLACRHYARGRYALLDAYRLAGVGRGGALLAPAYHCRTMIDPAVRLDAPVGLYRLRPDLSPDPASLAALREASPVPIRALLLTHYFGFAQDTAPLREFCDRHDICLIEDCSHALFNAAGEARIGSAGRYVVSSPYKFFPSPDGGTLYAAAGNPLPAGPLRQPRVSDELRGLLQTLRRCRRDGAPDPAALPAQLAALRATPASAAREFDDHGGGWSAMYLPAEEEQAALRSSRLVWALSGDDRVAAARRDNYRAWLAAVATLPGCQPLFPELPADCVPYMFPLLLEQPQLHFPRLKQLGVPIWRWDEMAISPCPVAADYRLRLLHLPCHQSLSAGDRDWMHAALRTVLAPEAG